MGVTVGARVPPILDVSKAAIKQFPFNREDDDKITLIVMNHEMQSQNKSDYYDRNNTKIKQCEVCIKRLKDSMKRYLLCLSSGVTSISRGDVDVACRQSTALSIAILRFLKFGHLELRRLIFDYHFYAIRFS